MKKYFKTEKELLQGIIDRKGDCLDSSWCLMCPFAKACIQKAITHAELLPQEERVKRAYDKLFDELMEKELDDGKTDEISKDSHR